MTDATTSATFIPPPPRLTGDYATDTLIIAQWFQAFYNGFSASGFVPDVQNGDPGTIDPNNLPDPQSSTISKAQATANAAIDALVAHSLYP